MRHHAHSGYVALSSIIARLPSAHAGRSCRGDRGSPARASSGARSSLKYPRREALDVDVVLVQAGVFAIALELDLELHLGRPHGQVADHTHGADARPSPRAVGGAARKLTVLNDGTRLRADSSARLTPSRCASATVTATAAARPDQSSRTRPAGFQASSAAPTSAAPGSGARDRVRA